ncbi:MAG: TatD family hydrolase [Phycisphaerae bacterium]|nr:TatD family hydrolase [Phycisphaerae bacterium]
MSEFCLIDTHCHLGFDELSCDLEGVLSRSEAAGVCGWVNVGTNIEQCGKVVELAKNYENMYAAVGIHPHYAKDADGQSLCELEKLAQAQKVVAIGETGLDFHYNLSSCQDQIRLFESHLELASKLNLPVIVHSRDAFEQTLEVLDGFEGKIPRVVFHCFSEDDKAAKLVIDRGWHVSFTGVVTFKNADKARAAMKAVPIERLMLETDCPYMSPAPMRKQKINEPALMVHTARLAAEVMGVEFEEFARKITAVSQDFFGIKLY